MGIKQLYNDILRKLPKEYGDVSVMEKKHKVYPKNIMRILKNNKLTKY